MSLFSLLPSPNAREDHRRCRRRCWTQELRLGHDADRLLRLECPVLRPACHEGSVCREIHTHSGCRVGLPSASHANTGVRQSLALGSCLALLPSPRTPASGLRGLSSLLRADGGRCRACSLSQLPPAWLPLAQPLTLWGSRPVTLTTAEGPPQIAVTEADVSRQNSRGADSVFRPVS